MLVAGLHESEMGGFPLPFRASRHLLMNRKKARIEDIDRSVNSPKFPSHLPQPNGGRFQFPFRASPLTIEVLNSYSYSYSYFHCPCPRCPQPLKGRASARIVHNFQLVSLLHNKLHPIIPIPPLTHPLQSIQPSTQVRHIKCQLKASIGAVRTQAM